MTMDSLSVTLSLPQFNFVSFGLSHHYCVIWSSSDSTLMSWVAIPSGGEKVARHGMLLS